VDGVTIPSSLVGAIVFFLLLAIIAFVVIREAVKVIFKPALVVILVIFVATWAGILDQTLVGNAFEWAGDKVLSSIQAVADWVADGWEGRGGE
jgi:hypothetical protein